jgi:hypothetical protein
MTLRQSGQTDEEVLREDDLLFPDEKNQTIRKLELKATGAGMSSRKVACRRAKGAWISTACNGITP